MNFRVLGAVAAGLLSVGAAVAADSPPPEGALPLSEVVSALEAAEDIRWIDEIEWDADGYWEVEYHTQDGRRVEARLDPMTGATLQR